jgi:SAM-dependent methyltransferase
MLWIPAQREDFQATYSTDNEPWEYSTSGAERLRYQRTVELARQFQPRPGRVLEVGCGLGLMTRLLGPYAGEVVAIDVAVPAVQKCAAQLGHALPNVRLAVGTLTDPAFEAAAFDVIFYCDGLVGHQLTDQELRVVGDKMRAMLASGGIIVLSDYLGHRQFAAYRHRVAALGFEVLREELLHDRLWFQLKSWLKLFRSSGAVRRFLASEGLARGLARLSAWRGEKGSKHLCRLVRPQAQPPLGEQAGHTATAGAANGDSATPPARPQVDITGPGPLFRGAARLPWLGRMLARVVIANLEMTGLLVDGLNRWRAFVLLSVVAGVVADYYARPFFSTGAVVGAALGLFVVRQAFLLGSFGPGGVADWLRRRLGEAPGARAYEGLTALFFYHRSYSFALLVEKTAFLDAEWLLPYGLGLQVVGWLGIGVGVVVNTWAFLLVGRPAFYYLDMYYGRFLQPFAASSLYRVLPNPMYSLGQLPAYGLALLAGSWPGLLYTAVNQACAYLFYAVAERPHVRAVRARTRREKSRAGQLPALKAV